MGKVVFWVLVIVVLIGGFLYNRYQSVKKCEDNVTLTAVQTYNTEPDTYTRGIQQRDYITKHISECQNR